MRVKCRKTILFVFQNGTGISPATRNGGGTRYCNISFRGFRMMDEKDKVARLP